MAKESIENLSDLTEVIEETCKDQLTVLFRGQQKDWSLLPSIMREELTYDNLLEAEQNMLKEFQSYSVPYLHYVPKNTVEWLALEQHHGLPTRLIDWSQNPLSALWFAVNKPPINQEDGILWIFKPDDKDFIQESELDSLEFNRYTVYAPKHITERITSQFAFFTIHKYNKGSKDQVGLEQVEDIRNKLIKLSIPYSKFAHLRYQLHTCGINAASVYPGLDGICSRIKWWNCYLTDELETFNKT